MKSFLIGSVPFESVDEALDYVFSFDVPTLPNLPKIFENEFMLNQAFDVLKGYKFTGAGLKEDRDKQGANLHFSARDGFFERLDSDYKWQACGPLTLLSALDHHPESERIVKQYLDRLISTQKEFNLLSDKSFLFFLDEPVLAFCENDKDILKNLYIELKSSSAFDNAMFGVHVCSKVGFETLTELELDLYAIDPSLYDKDEIKRMQQLLGQRLVYTPVSSKGLRISYNRLEEIYSAPACGGALSSECEMEQIKNTLID